jgi:hypothetical protein
MSVVSILSGADDDLVALAELVAHGVERTAFTAAPWIKVTAISTIGQPPRPLPLACARYDLYIQNTGQTFLGCVATAAAGDPVTFLATGIVDDERHSVVE